MSPYVARLEDLSGQVASLTQSKAALEGLRVVSRGVEGLKVKLRVAQDRHQKIALANVERADSSTIAEARCIRFASWMTSFLNGLTIEPWTFGAVQLRPSDMGFFVGGQPWRERLGGETKVSFLLSYHYALLRLSEIDEPSVRSPGLVILDNPVQQGVPDSAVADALQRLEEAAVATGGSVIAAFARSLPTKAVGKSVIRLARVYGAGEETQGPHTEEARDSGSDNDDE